MLRPRPARKGFSPLANCYLSVLAQHRLILLEDRALQAISSACNIQYVECVVLQT